MARPSSSRAHAATARVEVIDWDRNEFDVQEDGTTLSRVRFVHAFSGDLEGEGVLEYLMAIGAGGEASYVGMERVRGRLHGREGSFVLQHAGDFTRGLATVHWTVVPGSGTGELRGLRGEGGFVHRHATAYPVTLRYDLDEATPAR